MPKPVTAITAVLTGMFAACSASADDWGTLLAAAKITLQQAIERGTREAPGGVVVEAELEKEGGLAVAARYEEDKGRVSIQVKLVADGKERDIAVDATTGQVTAPAR